MRTSHLFALVPFGLAAGCGSLGHWGSSDNGAGGDAPTASAGPSPRGGFGVPDFGATRSLDKPPPAISGGTMLVSNDGATAVIADPDRDSVYVVDLAAEKVTATIALQDGDEPGRVVEDKAGHVHVALRSGGALVTIDKSAGTILARRPACGAPRGVAYDPAADVVHVACAGGELVTFPAAGGDATRRLTLETDLRDVIVQGSTLLVSRFRTAEVLTVASDGKVSTRRAPPDDIAPYMVPRIAWRMIPSPGASGGGVVVHQRASSVINNGTAGGSTGRAAYYSGDECSGFGRSTPPAVAAAVTDFGSSAAATSSVSLPGAVLPVDIAVSPAGSRYAVVAAGNGHTSNLDSIFTFSASEFQAASGCVSSTPQRHVSGQLTAVAFKDADTVVAFSREPAALHIVPRDESQAIRHIQLSTVSREDTGHAIFHSNTGLGIACASCHVEGGEDGLVWSFSAQGRRRTPSLKGTLEGTAPYHWNGDLADVPALVHRVYEEGMSGPQLQGDQSTALKGWLFQIPRPAALAVADQDAVLRGKALFEGQAACSTCHNGAHLTNNTTVDVGTGSAVQVPPLIGVGMRAPYLHSGCAQTLADRFGPCGGGDSHGKTSNLTGAQIGDLVSYLSTL